MAYQDPDQGHSHCYYFVIHEAQEVAFEKKVERRIVFCYQARAHYNKKLSSLVGFGLEEVFPHQFYYLFYATHVGWQRL